MGDRFSWLLGFGLLMPMLILAPAQLAAQPVSGLYVAGAGGVNLSRSQTITVDRPAPAAPAQATTKPDIGPAAVGGLGYGFGNGWRMEVEGGRRR